MGAWYSLHGHQTSVNPIHKHSPDGLDIVIKPLAKLNETIKVADTRNEGEAESETFSAITVTF